MIMTSIYENAKDYLDFSKGIYYFNLCHATQIKTGKRVFVLSVLKNRELYFQNYYISLEKAIFKLNEFLMRLDNLESL